MLRNKNPGISHPLVHATSATGGLVHLPSFFFLSLIWMKRCDACVQQVKCQNTELLQAKPLFFTAGPMHICLFSWPIPLKSLHSWLETFHCISSRMHFGCNSAHRQQPLISVKGLLPSSLLCHPEMLLFSSISFPLNRLVITFVTLPDKTPAERIEADSSDPPPHTHTHSPLPPAFSRVACG